MSVVHVAIPMLRGRRYFKIEKGRRWSVIEHLMLDAVAEEPTSAEELAIKSNLPRRIVVEAFIRLMRVGWVEITPGPTGPIFQTTDSGLVQADAIEMRAATTVQNKWLAFSIDRVAGSVFRGREMLPRPRGKITAPEGEHVVFLEPSERHSKEDLAEIYAALENEDELIVGAEPLPEPLFEGFATVTVRDGVIENLPGRAREELGAAILSAAAKAGSVAPPEQPFLPALPKDASKPIRHTVDALFDHDDLILDGDAHEALLANALGRARHGVLIHSTFVGADGWKTALPIILGAASRGVKVQIFWGQDDDARGSSSSRQACEALRAAIAEAGRGDDIIVHPFTTGSHAKLVIADDGQGAWSATIGSCNWLSTDFKSFEASFRLRDPVIVGEMVRHLANLAIGDDGIWGPAAGELTVLGRRIGSATAGTGRKTGMRVLLAPDHADLLLEARDRSVRRMLVASHRIGIGGRPMTIIPALSAAKEKGVAVSLFYGRPTGRLSGHDVAALALDLKKSGVDIRPVHRPRLHAKAVAWDDNALAVSSLNWLSADPSETALRTELGIFVEMNKLADLFVRRFEHARAVL